MATKINHALSEKYLSNLTKIQESLLEKESFKSAALLQSDLKLRANANIHNNCNFLVVEGTLDKTFILRLNQKNLKYILAENILNPTKFLYKNSSSHNFSNSNLFNNDFSDDATKNRECIIFVFKNPFNHKFLQDNKIFGMIDRDFNAEYPDDAQCNNRLFSNDTHDLETMLLQSDKSLLLHFNLSEKDINEIFFKSYQLALVRQAIFIIGQDKVAGKQSFPNQLIVREPKKVQDYNLFFDGQFLNVDKYLLYIRKSWNNGKPYKEQKLFTSLKKFISPNKKWQISFEKFISNFPKDFWQLTNGHDLANIICLKLGQKNYNKELEGRLIKEYNYESFKSTTLYNKLHSANLID
ncbi:MAG: hypothetical protein J6J24_05210 [Clostridia bacterium]|nr:hypothetical protein [Clostridia bacterium]